MSKKAVKAVGTGGLSLIDDSGAFSTGASSAKRAQKAQTAAIAEQAGIEKQRVAEGESEIKKRRALAKHGRTGRKSLIATSQTGLPTTLGGSNGTT